MFVFCLFSGRPEAKLTFKKKTHVAPPVAAPKKTEEELVEEDLLEAEALFETTLTAWQNSAPEGKALQELGDLLDSAALNLDIAEVYSSLEDDEEVAYIVKMAMASKGQLGAVSSESFAERVFSCVNILVNDLNRRLKPETIEKLVMLRMNREWILKTKAKYREAFKTHQHDSPDTSLFSLFERRGRRSTPNSMVPLIPAPWGLPGGGGGDGGGGAVGDGGGGAVGGGGGGAVGGGGGGGNHDNKENDDDELFEPERLVEWLNELDEDGEVEASE